MDVVRKIESLPTDDRDRPGEDVVIEECGHEAVAEPFTVSKEEAVE